MYARTAIYSVVVMGDLRQSRPLTARWGAEWWRRHDRWCV